MWLYCSNYFYLFILFFIVYIFLCAAWLQYFYLFLWISCTIMFFVGLCYIVCSFNFWTVLKICGLWVLPSYSYVFYKFLISSDEFFNGDLWWRQCRAKNNGESWFSQLLYNSLGRSETWQVWKTRELQIWSFCFYLRREGDLRKAEKSYHRCKWNGNWWGCDS